jgi:hypothetical protein
MRAKRREKGIFMSCDRKRIKKKKVKERWREKKERRRTSQGKGNEECGEMHSVYIVPGSVETTRSPTGPAWSIWTSFA